MDIVGVERRSRRRVATASAAVDDASTSSFEDERASGEDDAASSTSVTSDSADASEGSTDQHVIGTNTGEVDDDVADAQVPSLQAIKRALPAHVFTSSLATSMYYVVRSATFVVGLGFALFWSESQPWFAQYALARWAVRALYWLLQGTVFWGIFTLGHDCGHSSFSRYPSVNWLVGNALHSFILTPYESWRVSHRHHHKNTGNMDRDEIFYPMREGDVWLKIKVLPFLTPALTWFAYLCFGHSPRNVYHFTPFDPLFIKSRGRVAASVLTYAGMCFGIYSAGESLGWMTVAEYYVMPLIVFATWLVITTFLHHNEPGAVWYSDKTWTYVKGNLKSVDRGYWPFDNIIHDIGTHQIHHLFPIIPHYKLVEATEAFREAFPHLVRRSEAHFLPAFFKTGWMYMTAPSPSPEATMFKYPGDGAKAGKSL